MIVTKYLLLCLFTLGSAAAHCQTAVSGAGASSCGVFLEYQEKLTRAAGHGGTAPPDTSVGWIQGFLSGLNIQAIANKSRLANIPDVAAIKYEMVRRCEVEPLKELYLVAYQLHWDLSKN